MNRTETSQLLALIARYDNRRTDDATVIAWHAILNDLHHTDCQTAVIKHISTSTDYLMPVHIRRIVDTIDRDRRRQAREAREDELAAIAADSTRHDRSTELRAFVDSIRSALPHGDPDTLRHGTRYWRQIRENRQRQEHAQPNPHYDPTALQRLAHETPETH